MKKAVLGMLAVAAATANAATVVDVTGAGAEKTPVSIQVSNPAYAQSLKRNLELSGLFVVQPKGAITVSGTPGATVSAVGRGKRVSSAAPVTDDRSARMAARRLSDAMCENFGGQKGFACDRIVFVNRKGADNAEMCIGYPDGFDVRQLTADAKASVGPRWKNSREIYYTGFLKSGPQVYQLDVETGKRSLPWGTFKGLSTGAAVSPDGTRVAIILSFQGNPELYLLQGGRYQRLTNTPSASEGQPTWSPDGRQICYVSDETRHPQLYVIDVASRKSRRITSRGSQNVDPDWGRDGRITYITKRGGAQVAVIDPSRGEASAELVTDPGSWEHPSWSRDNRHVVASRDRALFVVDTMKDGDKPRQMFSARGNWITPSWAR